eukprot:GHVQ01008968.1.p1 GENE.GHVQ01008968.1~~GHVQ01008968.1.p1  ORF type:complete len:114 (-),score=7.95 GHVQ01008968.1:292-633(-)
MHGILRACMYVFVCVGFCGLCVYVSLCVCVGAYVCLCVCSVCVYVCAYGGICVFMFALWFSGKQGTCTRTYHFHLHVHTDHIDVYTCTCMYHIYIYIDDVCCIVTLPSRLPCP